MIPKHVHSLELLLPSQLPHRYYHLPSFITASLPINNNNNNTILTKNKQKDKQRRTRSGRKIADYHEPTITTNFEEDDDDANTDNYYYENEDDEKEVNIGQFRNIIGKFLPCRPSHCIFDN